MYREGQALDRPGPEGGTWGPPTPHAMTTHSRPLQGLPGPASLSLLGGLFGVLDPVLPTRYTHPACTHPYPVPSLHRRTAAHRRPSTAPRTCTYDQFGTPVGEPRGIEHTANSGSQTGLYRLLRFTRPFDWVMVVYYRV